MTRTIMVGMLLLCVIGPSHAYSDEREQLYDRVERLERENLRLRAEIARLQEQRQERSGYGFPSHYGNSPLNEASRGMSDLNRLKDSWDRLRK